MIAVIVVDMVKEFVTGKFGSERAVKCAKNIEKLIKIAREKGWQVIFTKDVHLPGDFEFRVWGEHCIAGTEGTELVFETKPEDIIIEKMRYDAFFNTPLDTILRNLGVKKIILAGISTDICVQHTAAGAFYRNYEIAICEECTESIDEETKQQALEYMKRVYGAKVIKLEEVSEW